MVRSIIKEQLNDFERAEELASKSKLTQTDIDEITSKMDEDMAKHFKVKQKK